MDIEPQNCIESIHDEKAAADTLKTLEFNSLLADLLPVKATAERTVKTVLSKKEFEYMCSEAKNAKMFSIDLETTGLNPMECKIVGAAVSIKEGSA